MCFCGMSAAFVLKMYARSKEHRLNKTRCFVVRPLRDLKDGIESGRAQSALTKLLSRNCLSVPNQPNYILQPWNAFKVLVHLQQIQFLQLDNNIFPVESVFDPPYWDTSKTMIQLSFIKIFRFRMINMDGPNVTISVFSEKHISLEKRRMVKNIARHNKHQHKHLFMKSKFMNKIFFVLKFTSLQESTEKNCAYIIKWCIIHDKMKLTLSNVIG